jgi:hypothetical protein
MDTDARTPSGSGTPPPRWYVNLAEHPNIEVNPRGRRMKLRARLATPEEKPALWPICDRHYAPYAEYRKRTNAAFRSLCVSPSLLDQSLTWDSSRRAAVLQSPAKLLLRVERTRQDHARAPLVGEVGPGPLEEHDHPVAKPDQPDNVHREP